MRSTVAGFHLIRSNALKWLLMAHVPFGWILGMEAVQAYNLETMSNLAVSSPHSNPGLYIYLEFSNFTILRPPGAPS